MDPQAVRASRAMRDAERYLDSLEMFGMRFGLERMRRLMTALDSPHERFRSIHVLGSNGKSSTVRMIAALLTAHDLRTGAYLSPHLASWAERIEVAGRPVEDERFAAAVNRVAEAATLVDRTLGPGDRVTQFEALTAAAYWELARAGVEAAAVEAGLGGRYDATSVIRSAVQVLTNVSLEHTRWLGPTETHIAEEKLAVVSEGGTVVAGRLGAGALGVAERVTKERGARLLLLGRDFDDPGVPLSPQGAFQRENFAVAVAAAEAFHGALDPARVREAAQSVRTPGRLEVVAHDPLTIRDGAHNPAGASALAEALPRLVGERRVVGVMSVLDDKDASTMLGTLLPLFGDVVFTRSSRRDALPPATLASLARQLGGPATHIEPSPRAALARARELAGREGAVVVTGSIYLLSDLARDAALPA
ncbi:MAG TPA: cyanophycin synthetase [Solirubrobacterales bacterium]|nr:cyanophycin synthetase [Solirubrobacterales bacterium]